MLEVPGELLDGAFAVTRARKLGVGEKALRCAAAATVLPSEAVFSHWTAAELLGLWLPHREPAGGIHVTVPAGRTPPRRPGMTGHGTSTWRAGDLRSRGGLRVTSAARTGCDLAAAGRPVEELVVLFDGALCLGLGLGLDDREGLAAPGCRSRW